THSSPVNVQMLTQPNRKIINLEQGLVDREKHKILLKLWNCLITTCESVMIVTWQFHRITRIAVNIAANSAIKDERNVVTNADEKEIIGEHGFVCSQVILILIEGVPKPIREPSV
ncbi:1977_t:CDS:2, partial [Funneliformis caledonium]